MPWLILRLLGIGKWLREAATGLLCLIRTYPLQAALIASMCLSGWLWHGKSKAIEQRDAWHFAFDKQKAAYTAAQQEAEAKAIAAKQAQEAKDEQRRKDADNALKQDLADDSRRADVYAGRMRCQAPRSAPSGANLSSAPEAPQVVAGPGAVAELVGITRTDLDICTVNSRRLLNAHDWALADALVEGK